MEDIANRLNSEYFRYFTIFKEEEIVGGVLYKCKGVAQTALLLCEKEFFNAKYFWVDFPEDLIKNRLCYEKVGFVDTGSWSLVEGILKN